MKKLISLFALLSVLATVSCQKEPSNDQEQKEVAVESVSLDKTSVEMTVGEELTLTATILPENASNTKVSWSVDNGSVASVIDGKVKAIGAGNAVVTVTTKDGGKTATCSVKVNEGVYSVESVSVNPKSAELEIGETVELALIFTPENATNKNVSWSSDNTSVATVDGGTVVAIAPGEANITVTTEDGSKTDVCTITVKAPAVIITIADAPADGSSFKFDHTKAIYAGESTLSWTCSKSDASFVIAVSKNSDMSSAGEVPVGAATSVTLTNQFVNAMAAVAGASFGNNTIYYCVRSVGASDSEIRNIVVDTEFDSFIDPRDNEIYTVTKIGDKYWMSENMRATKYSDGGEFFTNDVIYSTTYSETIFGKREGLFYSFANAVRKYYNADEMSEDNLIGAGDQVQGICPDGWHVANNNDWTDVVTEACSILGVSFADIFNGGYPNISKALCFKGDLKETCTNEGSNDLGLYILPSNYYYNLADGFSTDNYGWSAKVWSATMQSIWSAWAFEFATWNANIDAWYYGCHPEGGVISAMNVRCVKDY